MIKHTHLNVLRQAELLPDPARGEGRGGVLVAGVLFYHRDARALSCGVCVVCGGGVLGVNEWCQFE